MATAPNIDSSFYTSLLRMQQFYDSILVKRGNAVDRYNAQKTTLDAQWQADLKPVMQELYWYPFRNGLDEAPVDEAELRQWLKRRYKDAAVVAVLFALLQRYQLQAFNLGGQTALGVLDIDGLFTLTNPRLLKELDEHAAELTGQGTEISLIDTTIDDLVVAVPKARSGEGNAILLLGTYIALRTAQRTELIERTERPFQVGNGLSVTYQNNGVEYIMYDINGIGCARICAPDHGQIFPANRLGRYIPRHPRCDCIWTPVRYDRQVVGTPPVSVLMPGLPRWAEPATPWLGGNS